MKRSCPSSLRSFTLVELLVVIAIVVLLAGVSTAAITHAIRAAHLSVSTANLRQIGSAITIYAGDNDSVLPVWYNYSQSQYWWQTLAPYLNNSQGTNYNAPAYHDPGDSSFDGSSYDQLSLTISYGYNYMVMGRSDESTDAYPARRMANIITGSQTLAASDGQNTNSYGYIDPYGHGPDTNRYQGVTPGVFLDGHVEIITIGTNFEGESPYFLRN